MEADELIDIVLSNVVASTVDAADIDITDGAQITILNDDQAVVTIADVSGNEDDGPITITLTLDNAVQDGFDVDVSTADGSATVAGNDYTAVVVQTISFTGGAGETQTFTVTPTADATVETNETFSVSMSAASVLSGLIDTSDGATVTILNDDTATLTIDDVSGNEDDGAIVVTVTVDNAVSGGFAVGLSTADGTATLADSDYTQIIDQNLNFVGNAGEAQTLSLIPTADSNIEPDETLTISISSSLGTLIGFVDVSDDATITIVNDDNNLAPVATPPTAPVVLEDAVDAPLADDIEITDVDGDDQTVTFTITGGTVTLGTSGITFAGGGNGSASFTAQGTLADINTALDAATFSPTANLNGVDVATIEFISNDGISNSNTASVTFSITAVNDAPTFVIGPDQTVLEDAGMQTVGGFATSIDDGDPEAIQSLTFVLSNDNTSLFSVQPVLNVITGELAYTPADDANGSATVTVTLLDNGGTANGGVNASADQTFTITVNPVNDEPNFILAGDQTVLENSGVQTIMAFATLIDDGDDEVTQTLTFNVSNDNNALFETQPSIDAVSGDLIFTLAIAQSGSATVTVNLSDDGGTANGGVDTSADQTFVINVTPLNNAPSFTLPVAADQTVDEDAGAQTVDAFATDIDDNNPEAVQALTFNVSNDNNTLFSMYKPSIDETTGNLNYTPANDANGVAVVTVNLSDDGGTAGGGVDTSADQTFMITVNAVNDEPSFVIGSDQMVDEDAGTQSVIGFASSIEDGDPEIAQVLTFNVSNDNNGLFSAQPSIDPVTGDLTFTPADDANGSALITVNLTDDGGTLNGGDDTTPDQAFLITVNAINDLPTFTLAGDQTIDEDAGAQLVTGFATDIDDGDPELTQVLTFNVFNDNNALFVVQPSIDEITGDLTYTPVDNTSGMATISVSLSDDGGATSPTQSFVITINTVNDEPSFVIGGDQTIDEDTGPQTVSGFATSIDDGDPGVVQTLTFNISNDNNALFSVQPSIDEITGDLTYTPADNLAGSAMVTVFLMDDGGTDNGGDDTSPSQTFIITVNPINDAPVFAIQGDQTIDEDAGAQVVTSFATGIDDGDTEVMQALSFNISNDNNALFSIQPVIDLVTGDLSYTPADNANGVATITVSLSDDGGTANGGVDTSADQIFTITINAINDEPVLVILGDQSVDEDAGPQTVSGFASSIDDGDPEVVQMLTFNVSNDSNAIFSVQPAIDIVTGDLTYTPADNANGVAIVTVNLMDDGGTANGGDDTTTQTFLITVNSVNDIPVVADGQSFTVTEDSPANASIGFVSASDADSNISLQDWTITNGNPDFDSDGNAALAINSFTGELTVNDPDDLQAPNSFGILVTVGDGISTSSAEIVTIDVIDTSAPNVEITSAISGITNVDPISLTITFDDPVTGLELSDFITSNATLANLAAQSESIYTVDASADSDGELTVSLPSGAVTNSANDANIASNVFSITFDSTSPTVTLEAVDPGTDPFTVNILFSEPVDSSPLEGDFTVTNGAISGILLINDSTFEATFTPSITDGVVTILLDANAVADNAGNPNVVSNELSITIDIITGIEFEELVGVNFFPNPVSDFLTIELPADVVTNDVTIEVIGLNGALVRTLNTQGRVGRYDLSNIEDGIYLIRVQENDRVSINRLLIIR